MGLSGKYTSTFEKATHALPEGMHMDADYPFMLPSIKEKNTKTVTLIGRAGQEVTVPIYRRKGKEFCFIEQTSTFERMCGGKPQRFKFNPFIGKEF